MTYFKAPPDWDEKQPNPFTPDGSYGPEWSCFRMLDADDDIILNGTGDNGLYRFLAGRKVENLETKLADFLRYENAHGRKVIVSFPPDIAADELVNRALASVSNTSTIRPDDPRWIVHSTSLEAWERIRTCGELRSLARLRGEGIDARGVGLSEFREPDDYAEYVMLCRYDHIAAEHVVASQVAGRVITEEDTPYEPGVRLYFDARRIILDGLAVRDGLHILKVHDHLPLERYLVATISVEDIDPRGEVSVWTPRTFLDRANEWFTFIGG